jgi:hypothetical protein
VCAYYTMYVCECVCGVFTILIVCARVPECAWSQGVPQDGTCTWGANGNTVPTVASPAALILDGNLHPNNLAPRNTTRVAARLMRLPDSHTVQPARSNFSNCSSCRGKMAKHLHQAVGTGSMYVCTISARHKILLRGAAPEGLAAS